MAYVIGDDCRVSAPLRQFLRVRSILSIPICALSAVPAQVFVLLRLSAWAKQTIQQLSKKNIPRLSARDFLCPFP